MGTIGVPTAEDFPGTADLAIIGGGIIGVATAFWAGRAGLSVVCLERRDALGSLTTAASEECFRAQFSEPENIRMMKASIDSSTFSGSRLPVVISYLPPSQSISVFPAMMIVV